MHTYPYTHTYIHQHTHTHWSTVKQHPGSAIISSGVNPDITEVMGLYAPNLTLFILIKRDGRVMEWKMLQWFKVAWSILRLIKQSNYKSNIDTWKNDVDYTRDYTSKKWNELQKLNYTEFINIIWSCIYTCAR